jgi:hypothetical protein
LIVAETNGDEKRTENKPMKTFVQHFDATDRVNRPDVEEYRVTAKRGSVSATLELWWDDQAGADEGWCVRIPRGAWKGPDDWRGRDEQDIPVKGRRDSRYSTIRANLSAAINGSSRRK